MQQEFFTIEGIPAVLYGEPCNRLWLCIHGRMGCKEEAEGFAANVCPKDYQVLAIDLPGHGARKGECDTLDPWQAVPELQAVLTCAKARWHQIGLHAGSIGAWLSLMAFQQEHFERCLFISPVLDMEKLIGGMMQNAGVTEETLRRQQVIPVEGADPLSWQYLTWVREHPLRRWDSPTAILYGEHDALTDRATVEDFSRRFHGELDVMLGGEHWFHTPEQIAYIQAWEKRQSVRSMGC